MATSLEQMARALHRAHESPSQKSWNSLTGAERAYWLKLAAAALAEQFKYYFWDMYSSTMD